MTIIISMAGRGSRFLEKGFDRPKYEIMARDHSLLYWSLSSLTPWIEKGLPFHFITLKENNADIFIKKTCRELGVSQVKIQQLADVTDGQASTVLAARNDLKKDEPILIYNIDTHVRPQALIPYVNSAHPLIPCFKAQGDHWSFVKTDKDFFATETAEKVRISAMASVGLYGFHSFSDFEMAYEQTYLGPNALKTKERYIAPMYNCLISQGKKFLVPVLEIEDIIPLGTPEELQQFLNS